MKLPTLTRAQWLYFGVTWALFAISIVVFFLSVAGSENAPADDVGFWLRLIASLVVPPILVAIASLAIFGASHRIKNAFGLAGCTFGVMFAIVMIIAIKPDGMLHGAKTLVFGSASGSPSEIAHTDAAWVDISPAFVDTTRIGRASHTSTDNKGHSSTRTRAVAPIITAHGEADASAIAAEQVALFMCVSDADDVIDSSKGNGTISGRMHAIDSLEKQAIEDAKVAHVALAPRCVVPGRGASTFWLALWILVILVGATGGASLVTAVAAPKR